MFTERYLEDSKEFNNFTDFEKAPQDSANQCEDWYHYNPVLEKFFLGVCFIFLLFDTVF